MRGAIKYSILMCHAPIVIPEIARESLGKVKASTDAMNQAAHFIVAKKPDLLIVLSPHTPRYEQHFSILVGDTLSGDFSRFGFPEIRLAVPNATKAMIEEICSCAESAHLTIRQQSKYAVALDHGALVPLYFLWHAGWTGPTCVISFPMNGELDQFYKLGCILQIAADKLDQTWGIVASGDMSHRTKPEAPAGFHPKAQDFDNYLCDALTAGDIKRALRVDCELRELAAEDIIESLAVVAGAYEEQLNGCRVLSYENPFGVGYMIAVLNDATA